MPIESRVTGRDDRVALLGPDLAPLFDDGFVRSCDLYEAFLNELACDVFRRAGLADAYSVPRSVDEAIDAAGLAPAAARVPVEWLVAMLRKSGALARDGGRHVLGGPLPERDARSLRDEQAAHDARCLASYDLAAYAARHYPPVLAGATTGEQVLATPEALELWSAYFSNANPLYGISNTLGAIAAARALGGAAGAVLELGAGLGSGAEALLGRMPGGAAATYRATDVSPLFLRRAKRALAPRFPDRGLEFSVLDLDRPFAEAGVPPGSCGLVYGVNVLHVARDLAATLAEIRGTLAPQGTLVFAECIRPFAREPVHEEFVFNLLERFRAPVLHAEWRPNGGFLTPEQWTRALRANGFADVRLTPDVAAIRDAYPSFVVAAVAARPA